MPQPSSRRALLGTVASAVGAQVLVGCAMAPHGWLRAAHPSSVPSATRPRRSAASAVLSLEISFPDTVVSAFERAYPSVHLMTGSPAPKYQIIQASLIGAPGAFADFTAALRQINFDPSVLVAGSMAAWTNRGRTFGIPISEVPWGVRWRRDAFAAADIPRPDPDWTWDDFRSGCARLQTLAASGRVKGLGAALGPIALLPAGNATTPGGWFRGPTGWGFPPALWWEGLWQAFVWGFGASAAQAGHFTLTAPGTVSALQNLVDLARAFCLPANLVAALPTNVPHSVWFSQIYSQFAMMFAPYGRGNIGASWAWARLPRFPVSPVIPTATTAVALGATKPSGGVPPADAPETLVAAQFGVWLDSPAGVDLTSSAGTVPAAAAASIQTRFWTGPGPGSAAVVGDWQHFRGVYDGFPPVSAPQATVGNFVARAVSDAIEGTSSLPDALAGAEKRMNANVIQP